MRVKDWDDGLRVYLAKVRCVGGMLFMHIDLRIGIVELLPNTVVYVI